MSSGITWQYINIYHSIYNAIYHLSFIILYISFDTTKEARAIWHN